MMVSRRGRGGGRRRREHKVIFKISINLKFFLKTMPPKFSRHCFFERTSRNKRMQNGFVISASLAPSALSARNTFSMLHLLHELSMKP
jgi:hypothetical protein